MEIRKVHYENNQQMKDGAERLNSEGWSLRRLHSMASGSSIAEFVRRAAASVPEEARQLAD